MTTMAADPFTIVDLDINPYSATEAQVRKELKYWEGELEKSPSDLGLLIAVEELREMLQEVIDND